jgi:hypothetical protein
MLPTGSFLGGIKMADIPQRQFSLSKKPISEYTSDADLSVVMENAKIKKNEELWWECLRRRCDLKRQDSSRSSSPLELDFYAVMLAYEKLQSDKTGRNYRANRTWPMIEKPGGVKAALEKWALSKKKQVGFTVLIEHGQYDLTGEYLVLKYQDEFSPEVRSAARQGLIDAGAPPEKLPVLQ